MEWKTIKKELREFDENFAMEGDMYLYHGGKLIFVASSAAEPAKKNLVSRIKAFVKRKRLGGIVILNRRTLGYIYNVCKGVMPRSKEDFVENVMGSFLYNDALK